MIPYKRPASWIRYDRSAISEMLVEAKAVIASLKSLPCQRAWLERLNAMEFKREVAGTSRIEGADFTDKELEAAMNEPIEKLATRSQRQAQAAVRTYRWIATIPDGQPIDRETILKIHRTIVEGADDDHCEPGVLREGDHNVNFGQPRHRGAAGGRECTEAFEGFVRAISSEYRGHDPIVQALTAHYHLASMHPFGDGNGRTARALEALLLQRAGLRNNCFIAMSNYYYEEKSRYLSTLAAVRHAEHDLTEFILFALAGIRHQLGRLLNEIQTEISKALFENMMRSLFDLLKSPKKRVIAKRQVGILKFLLERGETEMDELFDLRAGYYAKLKNPSGAFFRDLLGLQELGTIKVRRKDPSALLLDIRLEWPTEITETLFFETLKKLPKTKASQFLNP